MGSAIGAYSQACTIITATYGPGTAPCATNLVSTYTAFEVWPTEAYTFTGLTAGVTYRFSLAGGANGAWVANYTVYNPSMTVVAFGTGDANNDITFTAAVGGTYTFGFFNTATGCGVESQVDNGFATLTAVSGPIPSCDPPITTCEAGILSSDAPVTLATITSTTDVNATGVIIPNSPTQGGQGVLFQPQAGGGGGLGGEFILSGVTLPYTFDADLNGVLSSNGFPLLTGLYNVRPAVYADNTNIFASICDTTFRARPVTFPTGGPVFCEAGVVGEADQAVCPGDIWNLSAIGDSIPLGGDWAWFFFNVDTTQADFGYFFGGSSYSGDLNADLAAAGLDVILPGVYEVVGAAYTVDELCDVTDDSFFITVYDAADPACSGCQSPTNLGVVQIGFGGTNPRVNATWTNPEGTTSCEVRGGRISTASYNAGEPEFVNIANTQIITATNGSTVNFNIALYNNPNIPFVVGSRYGYDVRCACADGSGFSEWANITPAATFVVPAPPAGINIYEGSKATAAEAKALSSVKSGNQMQLVGAPKQIRKADLSDMRPSAASAKSLQNNAVSLFPNPAQNDLNISIDATAASNLDVMVYDMTGRVVIAEQMIVAKGLNTMTIDVQNLEKGMYVIAIGDVKQPFVKK